MKHEGYLQLIGDSGTLELATYHCCHCQTAVIVQSGSRQRRGFCFNCMEPNCGRQSCVERCDPWEKQMQRAEAKYETRRSMGIA